LREAFAGLDTSPGFEARVAARVAALEAVPVHVQRAHAELRRHREAQRLRREYWLNAATAAGAGAAAIAVVWRHGPAVARWTEAMLSAAAEPGALMGLALGVLALGLWPLLRGWLPR
jgi:hypothetical protein